MRASSAIRSLFPFQQKNFLGGWQSTPSGNATLRNSVPAAFTTTTTKIAFVYASKQRCLNPISTKTLRVNSATKMMLGTWIKSFTTFLFTWTQKALQK
jgi:hypothetical protein